MAEQKNDQMTKSNYKACENDCKDCMEEKFMLEYACKKDLMMTDGEENEREF